MANDVVESELPGIEFVKSPVGEEPEQDGPKKRGRPKGSANKATLEQLRIDLTDFMVEGSAAIAPISPLAMAVIDERAERTANAIVTLAGTSPRLVAALKKSVKAKAAIDLAMLPIAISVALMVDYNRIAPDAMMAQKFGITEHYLTAYPPQDHSANGNGNGNGNAANRSGLFAE
jgi:hypothetical protein